MGNVIFVDFGRRCRAGAVTVPADLGTDSLGATIAALCEPVVGSDDQDMALRQMQETLRSDRQPEFRGANYEATKNLSCKDIAKRVRAAIHATYPDVKFRCRTDYNHINVTITSIPDHISVFNHEWLRFNRDCPHVLNPHKRYSYWVMCLVDFIEQELNSYNRDASDIQTDYFSVKFYSRVMVDYDIESARKDEELARI